MNDFSINNVLFYSILKAVVCFRSKLAVPKFGGSVFSCFTKSVYLIKKK